MESRGLGSHLNWGPPAWHSFLRYSVVGFEQAGNDEQAGNVLDQASPEPIDIYLPLPLPRWD